MAWPPMPIRAPIWPASGWRSGFGATSGAERHGGHAARKETPAALDAPQARLEGQEDSDEDNPIIIAEAGNLVVHEMAVSDAVMQMDLSMRLVRPVPQCISSGEINVVIAVSTTAILVGSILRLDRKRGRGASGSFRYGAHSSGGWHMD